MQSNGIRCVRIILAAVDIFRRCIHVCSSSAIFRLFVSVCLNQDVSCHHIFPLTHIFFYVFCVNCTHTHRIMLLQVVALHTLQLRSFFSFEFELSQPARFKWCVCSLNGSHKTQNRTESLWKSIQNETKKRAAANRYSNRHCAFL